MKKRTLLFMMVLIFISVPIYAGVSNQWAKTYGGSSLDNVKNVVQTSDGSFVFAGVTSSYGAGSNDAWVLKLDSDGVAEWEKTYGSNTTESLYSFHQTSDGGFVIGGHTISYTAGGADAWFLKLDSDGVVEWEKTYGGSKDDYFDSIHQTSDGGFAVAGRTSSYGAGYQDVWVLKLDSGGVVEWEKTYGGSEYDYCNSINQTSDGGFIIAGSTRSFGDISNDAWVLKLDSSGLIKWSKTYGGSENDHLKSLYQTSDGGFVVAGQTSSYGAGGADAWVLKLDSGGVVEWEKTYGGNTDDSLYSIHQTSDGGFAAVGRTSSYGAGNLDAWFLKLDSGGEVEWVKTYGGSNDDYFNSIHQTSDGDFAVAGSTTSYGAGSNDAWVLKLDSNGDVANCDMINELQSYGSTTNSVIAVSSSASVEISSARIYLRTATVIDTSSEMRTVCEAPSTDSDGDNIFDYVDNCQNTYNPIQFDADNDGTGDACDADTVYGTISGDIKRGVTVNIYRTTCGGDVLIDTTSTDQNGYYSFGDLESGKLFIVLTAGSYSFYPVSSWPVIPQEDIQSYDFTATLIPRFIDNDDGTVTDFRTNLIWLKNANCYGYDNWSNAMSFAAGLNSGECGLSDGSSAGDWRLATKEDLQGIGTDPPTTWGTGYSSDAWIMPGSPFVSIIDNGFWSSTEYGTDSAWHLRMGNGFSYPDSKTYSLYMWPVRSPN